MNDDTVHANQHSWYLVDIVWDLIFEIFVILVYLWKHSLGAQAIHPTLTVLFYIIMKIWFGAQGVHSLKKTANHPVWRGCREGAELNLNPKGWFKEPPALCQLQLSINAKTSLEPWTWTRANCSQILVENNSSLLGAPNVILFLGKQVWGTGFDWGHSMRRDTLSPTP